MKDGRKSKYMKKKKTLPKLHSWMEEKENRKKNKEKKEKNYLTCSDFYLPPLSLAEWDPCFLLLFLYIFNNKRGIKKMQKEIRSKQPRNFWTKVRFGFNLPPYTIQSHLNFVFFPGKKLPNSDPRKRTTSKK